MKNTAALLMALGLALPAMTLAQDGDQPRAPRRERAGVRQGAGPEGERPAGNREGGPGAPGQRPGMVPPLFAALDANHDGMIDEDEIKNAAEALKKLDKNNDGKITMDEMRPARPGGPGGEGANGRPEGAGDRQGFGPRGERNGPPMEGGRPPRRDAAPPPQQ